LSSRTFVVNYDERVFDDRDVMALRGIHALWSIDGTDARGGKTVFQATASCDPLAYYAKGTGYRLYLGVFGAGCATT
jgi:hypothetical protein